MTKSPARIVFNPFSVRDPTFLTLLGFIIVGIQGPPTPPHLPVDGEVFSSSKSLNLSWKLCTFKLRLYLIVFVRKVRVCLEHFDRNDSDFGCNNLISKTK